MSRQSVYNANLAFPSYIDKTCDKRLIREFKPKKVMHSKTRMHDFFHLNSGIKSPFVSIFIFLGNDYLQHHSLR